MDLAEYKGDNVDDSRLDVCKTFVEVTEAVARQISWRKTYLFTKSAASGRILLGSRNLSKQQICIC
jgi:hypothetical protein